MFEKRFEVIRSFGSIYKRIGKYEYAYIYEQDGYVEFEIVDDLFGQPSPANWDHSKYAQELRNKVSEELEYLVKTEIIKILED